MLKPQFRSLYSIDGGTVYEGPTTFAHNSALRAARRLFSGGGYKVLGDLSYTGHLVLSNGTNRAVIDIEQVPA